MDNITHTLTGAALGHSGLKRLTGLAMPALLIGANAPDIDVLGILVGENLAWRRGWTHGPLGLLALPVALAVALMAFDRWQRRRGTRPDDRLPVRFTSLLLLGYIGTLSHPLLDLMNTYGIRWLMPFSDRWYYGDVLFIVDPWIWLALGLGVWRSRRREGEKRQGIARPAVAALVVTTVYALAMHLMGRVAERHALRDFRESGLGDPAEVLASPVLVDPFRRAIVVRTADGYGFGDFRWSPGPRLTLERSLVPTRMDDPAIARAAAQHKPVADFLYWSRFPFAAIERVDCGTRVTMNDARYARRPHAGPFTVSVVVADSAC